MAKKTAQKPKEPAAAIPLKEEHAIKAQNLILKLQLIEQQVQAASAQHSGIKEALSQFLNQIKSEYTESETVTFNPDTLSFSEKTS